MNVLTHYYHKFPKVDRTSLGNQEDTETAYIYTLWENRCVKGILFNLYFKMCSFYKCSLQRLFLVKRKINRKTTSRYKKNSWCLSYFIFKTFFSMLSCCMICIHLCESTKFKKSNRLWVPQVRYSTWFYFSWEQCHCHIPVD